MQKIQKIVKNKVSLNSLLRSLTNKGLVVIVYRDRDSNGRLLTQYYAQQSVYGDYAGSLGFGASPEAAIRCLLRATKQ